MATQNRATLLPKLHKILRQNYKPLLPDKRPLMEQLLYAACLENTTYETADAAYGHLREIYFDWNEVRVSTVVELAEIVKILPHPTAAAANIKRILQNIFESTYSFDLETMKKQNIGACAQRLEKMEGSSPFIVAYVTQHGLEGHAIPLDRAALSFLKAAGLIDENEAASGKIVGLERTIPKNKGVEFGCLLHQAASEFYIDVQRPLVKKTLLALTPSLKDHWPKKSPKKEYEAFEKAKDEAARKEAEDKEHARQEGIRLEAEAKREAVLKTQQAKAAKLARQEANRQAAEAAKHAPKPKTIPVKPSPTDKLKSRPAPPPAKKGKKTPPAKHIASSHKKPAPSKSAKAGKSHPPAKKKLTTKQLSKRKPR